MTQIKFRDNAVTAVERNAEGITVHVRKAKGSNETLPPIRLRFGALSENVRQEALGYGMEVRLTRAAAIEHAKAGRPATAQERWDAINRLAEHYASGTDQWNISGGGGGGLNADTKALIEALCEAFGLDADVAEEQVRGMTQDERAALRADPEVKAALDSVYARRGASVDTQSLKEKLLGLKK